jgi:hypothetical protein
VLDHECRAQALQGHGVDVEEVDPEQTVGLGAQERAPVIAAIRTRWNPVIAQDPADRGGGGAVPEPAQLSLDADHAHVRFSVARRTISSVISSLIGGRPGGRGWRHFAATSLRCQRSKIAGVTTRHERKAFGRSRDKAASTARSAQLSCGRGLVRRSTATSWRSASISASLDAEDRASSANQDNP